MKLNFGIIYRIMTHGHTIIDILQSVNTSDGIERLKKLIDDPHTRARLFQAVNVLSITLKQLENAELE